LGKRLLTKAPAIYINIYRPLSIEWLNDEVGGGLMITKMSS